MGTLISYIYMVKPIYPFLFFELLLYSNISSLRKTK